MSSDPGRDASADLKVVMFSDSRAMSQQSQTFDHDAVIPEDVFRRSIRLCDPTPEIYFGDPTLLLLRQRPRKLRQS